MLATTELHSWLGSVGIDLTDSTISPDAMDPPFTNQVPGGSGESYGSVCGSGGYLEYIARVTARELAGRDLEPGPLPLVQGRNADFREYSLDLGNGRLIRFAAAYGFRNIQGLIRKIKLGSCDYDFVEVMACPSGCLNGGGQVKPAPGQSTQQLIEQLELMYSGELMRNRLPEENPGVGDLYRELVGSNPEAAQVLFHTVYHQRKKTVSGMMADW